MTVDIKTLRIGSHVEYDGKRVRVALVRDDGCICEYKDNGQDVIVGLGIEKQPIPITPEILTEIGFKYHEYDNGKLWEWDLPDGYKDYGYLEFDEETTTIWRGRLWSMKEIEVEFKVEYLHDLENIFYMFYGVELIKE